MSRPIQVEEGKWYPAKKRGDRLTCCHCCLTHILDYRVIKVGRQHHVEVRFRIDQRATDRMRKRAGIRVVKAE